MNMTKTPDLVDQLKINVALAFIMFEKIGIDKREVLRRTAEIDNIMYDSALEINNGSSDVNTINIDVTIAMLILIQRLEMVERLYGEMANTIGVSRDILDDETRLLALKIMDSVFKKPKN